MNTADKIKKHKSSRSPSRKHKSKKSKSPTKHTTSIIPTTPNILEEITRLNIDYLSTLDYVDMQNLCKTNKNLSKICNDDNLLKTIIFNRSGIMVNKEHHVSMLMKQLDDCINTIMEENYNNIPRWVNKELFWIDCKKVFYVNLVQRFAKRIIKYSDDLDSLFEAFWRLGEDFFIKLKVSFPFTSQDQNDYYSSPLYNDPVVIALSDDMINYIRSIIDTLDLKKIHYLDILDKLSMLFFVHLPKPKPKPKPILRTIYNYEAVSTYG